MTPEQEKLFEEHHYFAVGIAEKNSRKDADRPIAKQEALLALEHAASNFDSSRSRPFAAYAGVVIKNRLKDFARKNQRREREITSLDSDLSGADCGDWEAPKDQIPDFGPNPDREAERNEIRFALRMGIEQLTPDQGRIVEAYLNGHTFAEIARQNGISEQAAGQMFHRATDQLRPFVKSQEIYLQHFMPSGSVEVTCNIGPSLKSTPKPDAAPFFSSLAVAAVILLIVFFSVILIREPLGQIEAPKTIGFHSSDVLIKS